MKIRSKIGIFFACALTYSSAAMAVSLVLPPELSEAIDLQKCADEAGSWKCIFRNKTDQVINMNWYYGVGYDRDGVKINEGPLLGTIDPGEAAKINFSTLGYAGNVSRIVIKER